MSKQDRTYARTAVDLERKYNFGKTFAEVLGIATDAQEAAKEVKETIENLDQDEIFKLLTNDGKSQGVYRDENGDIYINASYIASGVLSSADGKIKINLDGGTDGPVFNTGISTNGLVIRADEAEAANILDISASQNAAGVHHVDAYVRSVTGNMLVRLTETYADAECTQPIGVAMELFNQNGDKSVLISIAEEFGGVYVASGGSPVGSFLADMDGNSNLDSMKINGKTVSWKDNGDGTFTLIGQ